MLKHSDWFGMAHTHARTHTTTTSCSARTIDAAFSGVARVICSREEENSARSPHNSPKDPHLPAFPTTTTRPPATRRHQTTGPWERTSSPWDAAVTTKTASAHSVARARPRQLAFRTPIIAARESLAEKTERTYGNGRPLPEERERGEVRPVAYVAPRPSGANSAPRVGFPTNGKR